MKSYVNGFKDLELCILMTDTTVQCPVRGYPVTVERMKAVFTRDERFKCSEPYISPSTFEHEDESDNLLWTDEDDRDLLKRMWLPSCATH